MLETRSRLYRALTRAHPPHPRRIFDLSFNSLSGTIPTEIGMLTALEKLWLAENRFSGKSNNQKDAVQRVSQLSPDFILFVILWY